MNSWFSFRAAEYSTRRMGRATKRRHPWCRLSVETLETRCLLSGTDSTALPLLPPHSGPPRVADDVTDGLGVNIHFTDPQPGEIRMLAAAGFRWVRMDFHWHVTERQPGQYDFAAYDRLLNSLAPYGIRALFILDYGNTLYDSGFPPRTPAGREAFARWVTAAVQHFQGRGILWELWNEPNLRQFWQPMPNVQDYILLGRAVGQAIRTVAPNETFIGPATSGIDLGFILACAQGGLLDYFDAVSVHPYRSTGPETAAADYGRLRSLIDYYAPKGRIIPILSGEWGYSSAGRGEEAQGKLLPRQWLTNLANNIPLSIWYDWHDDGPDPVEPEHHFGTVRFPYYAGRDPVYDAKPAYEAARTFTTLLSGNSYTERLVLPRTDDYALAFSDGAASRFVTWTSAATPHAATVPVPQGFYRMVSHRGVDLGVVEAAGNGLALTLNDAPVYLVQLDVVPAAPVHLAAAGGNGLLTLSWAASPGAISYNVYRGLKPGGEEGTPLATGITTTAFTDTGLSNGTTYYYLITAANDYGESNFSNEAAATPQAVLAFTVSINFSNNLREVPTAYVNDVGLTFGERGNGFRFGWNQDNRANARDRDHPLAADERYDSFTHMQKEDNPNAFWRIALPNGRYLVHVVAGDIEDNFDAQYAIAAQGNVVVRGTPTPNTRFFEGTVLVTVSNGLLTISNAAGALNNKIAFLDIVQAEPADVNFAGGFAGASGLQLNGGAAVSGTRLRLTDGSVGQTRSAFVQAPVNVQTFLSAFRFQLTNAVADGITFTLQAVGPTALGGGGGELGYGGIRRSAALKFDLFNNAGEGPNSTGLYTEGMAPTVPAIDLRGSGIDLHSGHVFEVFLSYDAMYLLVTITDETTGAAAEQFYTIDIPAVLGSPLAYAGFTGATGSVAATQDILSWIYTVSPGGAPGGGGRSFPSRAVPAGLDALPFFASLPEWYAGGILGFYQNRKKEYDPRAVLIEEEHLFLEGCPGSPLPDQELPPSVPAAEFEPVLVEAFRELRERFPAPMPLGE